MTFKQWWDEVGNFLTASDHATEMAAIAWAAATAAERERCARVADGIEQPGGRRWIKGSLYDMLRRETAAEIRRAP